MPEFELHDHRGKPRRMRNGKPFRYTSEALARTAKRIFESAKDCDTFYRVRPVIR